MYTWQNRPDVLKNLLNPAFISVVITSIIKGYNDENNDGIDFPLIQIAVPLIINTSINLKLPKTKRTSMPIWINSNINTLIGILNKSDNMLVYIKEGLLWGHKYNTLMLGNDHKVNLGPDANSQFFKFIKSNDNLNEYHLKSMRVGRWFAASGSPNTIIEQWRTLT